MKVIGATPQTESPGATKNIDKKNPRAGGPAMAAMPILPGGINSADRDEASQNLPPDFLWAIPQGVPPIIQADPTPRRVDPGPAIGL